MGRRRHGDRDEGERRIPLSARVRPGDRKKVVRGRHGQTVPGPFGRGQTDAGGKMIDLSGKHIFIAGGSRGIGATAARMAAHAGADVAVNYLSDSAEVESVVADIRSMGLQLLAVRAGVSIDVAVD